ncbi:MAG: N-acetyltransferase [Methanobrevibacter sp.]|nr:N-acetyltransferase [Methanobrevibacter sp.]
MIIRLENENDYLNVEDMVRNSFWNIYRPGAFEHYIVHNLRKDESFIPDLAYVIEKDDKIIAHINYSTGKIISEDSQSDAVVLGPVSVEKDYQNQGYGSKLIEYTLNLIKDKEIPFVFVIGDENYYQRFGFEFASNYNIFLDGTDRSDECPFFMIKVFDNDNLLKEHFTILMCLM